MTCIVGYLDKKSKKITIGGDSAGIAGLDITIRKDEKGGTFLVAYKNRLFRIEDDFQVSESLNGIDAIGCGADYALGSLHILLKQNLTPKEKVLKSLETASLFSAGVSKPFVINGT